MKTFKVDARVILTGHLIVKAKDLDEAKKLLSHREKFGIPVSDIKDQNCEFVLFDLEVIEE